MYYWTFHPVIEDISVTSCQVVKYLFLYILFLKKMVFPFIQQLAIIFPSLVIYICCPYTIWSNLYSTHKWANSNHLSSNKNFIRATFIRPKHIYYKSPRPILGTKPFTHAYFFPSLKPIHWSTYFPFGPTNFTHNVTLLSSNDYPNITWYH